MFVKVAASFLVLGLSISAALGVVDYSNCQDSQLCIQSEYKHITCGATGGFSPSCPSDRRFVEMTEAMKYQILDLHNRHRNNLASGNEPGYSPAAQMTTMIWNQDLADLAALNVRRCVVKHDCHNTPEMNYAGQNINKYANTAHFVEIPEFIEESVAAFWEEKKFASQANIDHAFGDSSGPKQVFHFLQMAADRSNQIGCAIAQWTDAEGKKDYLACNYSFGVISTYRVYQTGKPGSKCQTGTNPNYPALCSINEEIGPNDLAPLFA